MKSRREPIILVVVLATLASTAAFSTSAFAGFAADPRIGDVQLGKRDGVAYVKDTETVADSGSTLAPAGCPGKGDAWRIAGGGFSAGTAFNLINMTRPLDYTDADHAADDYWEVESNASGVGTKITSYAVCMKEPKLKYVTAVAPDSSDADRVLSVDCPGKTKPISGGGSISHSDSFLASLYPKGNSLTAAAHDSLDGTGNFTADAVCLKSRNIETVRTSRIVDPVTQTNVKVLPEAPAMAMGNIYQTQRGSTGIPDPFPSTQPVFQSVPFDGKDKDTIPDDGWKVGISNTSSEPMRITLFSTFYMPPGSRK